MARASAAGSRCDGGVRITAQKIGPVKPGASVVLPHSAQTSTGARAAGSSGQNGAAP